MNEARALLTELGALGEDGRLTATGEAMRRLPLPPRLGRMVAEAGTGAGRRLAADIAVLLTERGLGGGDVDLEERLRRFRADRTPRGRDAAALARRIAGPADPRQDDPGGGAEPSAGALLALAFPDRVAAARGARGHFLLSNGRGGIVDAATGLADAPLLVVAELQGQAKAAGRILSAAAISRDALEAVFPGRIAEAVSVAFEPRSGEVRARRRRLLGRAVLGEAQIPVPAGPAGAAALAEGLRALGLPALPFGPDGERLLQRLRFLAAAFGPPWPDLSQEHLLRTLEDWLMPFLPGVLKLASIDPSVLAQALRALVPAGLRGRIDALAPAHFEAPSGSRLPIRYGEDGPVLPVRVQELFGLRVHPAIADGRLPLTLELLSPAGRPIQITRDLPGFWAGSWRDVRADLRGRYPRHSWPEDPAAAAATARVKPRA